MGEKLTPVTEMASFELPDEGVGVFVLQGTAVIKERKDKEGKEKPGWEYKIQCVQEGGGADGSIHFENFFTESKGNFSLNRLFGFLTKVGVYKADAEVDSDTFKSETFAKKWQLLNGKKIGLDIEHQARKDDKTKIKSVAKRFLTVNEAKESGKAKGTVKEEAQRNTVDDGWGD